MSYINRPRVICQALKQSHTSLLSLRRTAWVPQRWELVKAQARRYSVPGEPAQEEEDGMSAWRRHRQEELREDRESKEPLFQESYPRFPSSPLRKSLPEFLDDFHERLANDEVQLAGRIRSKRVVGKGLIFVDIVNEFQKVQVMINKNKCNQYSDKRVRKFALLKNLMQIGDHISVIGVPTRTEAGELTLEARDMPELLAPAMEPLPEKLTDPRTRMKQRYVDMLVNKQAMDVLRLRADIIKFIRAYLNSKRFHEFQTPILARKAGGAVARPFVTRSTDIGDKDLALRIAPELWLKRLVVGGVDKVFEIGPSFRNEGIDATHNPEFTMCEFYSAYTNLSELIDETEEILYGLAQRAQEFIANQLTTLPPIDLGRFKRPFKKIEFIPALEQALRVRLPKLSSSNALPELLAVLKLAGIKLPGEVPDSLPKLLDRLASIYLEPLSFNEPVFILNHPACMSPLAKSFVCPQTFQFLSARAELFINGCELANMYEEENDPDQQRQKLIAHRALVNKPDGELGYETPEEDALDDADEDGDASPLDMGYVRALNYGLPPTGGWGCGIERLVMLFSGANRISDTLSFGTLKNVVGLSTNRGKHSTQPSDSKKSSS